MRLAIALACFGNASRRCTHLGLSLTGSGCRRPSPPRCYDYCSNTSTHLAMSTSTTEDPSFKRARLEQKPASSKVIGTHSGTFQADEAMGCWLLRQLPTYRHSRVVRSRDKDVLDPLDIVIDVGGVYNHETLRYDHHQRGYDERFDGGNKGSTITEQTEGRVTKLSAAGLVYRHYGKDVLKEFYPDLPANLVDLAYIKIYDKLLEALDAIDTGVEQAPQGVELLYHDSTGLASRVSRLNPRWNEVDESTGEKPNHDDRFAQAVELCGQDFVSVMTKVVESDIPARKFVEEALLKRQETDASGEIICFAHGGLPWRDHLYELEKEHKVDPLVKFVLYQDLSDMWRVQAVTIEGRGFENRLSLPASWRGVRDEDLASISGIEGARFCHAAGFIGGANTYEGVLAMAKQALAGKE